MFPRRLAIALALTLALAQARLAPHALAQAPPAGAPTPSHATAQADKPAAPARSQNPVRLDKQAEKIRRDVRRIGVGQTITVVVEDGDDLHGSITYIGDGEFDISEVDRRKLVTVRYGEVKKVRSGYGGISRLTGERTSPPRGLKIAAFAGLAALLALPVIILATAKE